MEQVLLYVSGVACVVAFILFGVDKLLARMRMCRVPESFLLAVSFLAGATGALLAMMLFRHKTRKRLFVFAVPLLSLLQIILLFYALS